MGFALARPEIPLSRVLTDRGTKYCSDPERHEDELYLGGREHRSHTHETVRTSGVALLQGDKSPSPEEYGLPFLRLSLRCHEPCEIF